MSKCSSVHNLINDLTTDFYGINVYMLFCFKDKVPAVRAQAVMALQRLQDPNNPKCPVVKGK